MVNSVTTANYFWIVWFLVGFICALSSYKEDEDTKTVDDWFAYCVLILGGFLSLGAAIILGAVGKLATGFLNKEKHKKTLQD